MYLSNDFKGHGEVSSYLSTVLFVLKIFSTFFLNPLKFVELIVFLFWSVPHVSRIFNLVNLCFITTVDRIL